MKIARLFRCFALLATLCLLCFVDSASAGGAFVSYANSGTFSAATTKTCTTSPTAGNVEIVWAFGEAGGTGASPSNIKDSAGNALTLQATVYIGVAGVSQIGMTYGYEIVPSGITSFTVTWASSQYSALQCAQYTLFAKPDAVDSTGGRQLSGSWSTGSMTPASAVNEVIIGAVGDVDEGGALTCTSPYTKRGGTNSVDIWCDQIVTSTSGSYQPNGTGSSGDELDSLGATFTTSASTKLCTILLLGAGPC